MSETELCRRVVEHLTAQGWTCHEEVAEYQGGPRCDLVAVRDDRVWAIEVKCHLGFDVIAQAHHWIPRAHRVSIVVPWSRDTPARAFAWLVCRHFGIGAITDTGGNLKPIIDVVPPAERPSITLRGLVEALHPDQIGQGKAGTNQGGFSTPFSRTCAALTEAVRRSPGITVRQAVDQIETHYASKSSARSSIATLAARETPLQALAGIRIDEHGKLWPVDAAQGAA